MEARENGHRFSNYYKWEVLKSPRYDYKRQGLLRHIMSGVIVNSKNEILQNVLKYFEKSLIHVMSFIDKLKHFKNYHYYNR
jgi:hypothetical protein